MNDIINIEIRNKSGHDDLKFCVRNLTGELTFDTYYFGLAIEPFEDISDLKKSVANFLNKWVNHINLMQNGHAKYFPIDFSDQYTGCLRVVKQEDEIEISYGTSNKEGWFVDINNPESYFDSITDFHSDTETLLIKKVDFIKSIQNQINLLTNGNSNKP